MPVVTVKFPHKLHAGQRAIYRDLGHRNVIRCGRRFGKTSLLEARYAKRAIVGRKIGWFTPDYKLMRPTFARLRKMLRPVISTANKTDALIELHGGGLIEFWTLDNEDAGRSRDYDDVVIDEAGLIKKGLKDIIEQAIAPTLLDRRGTLTMAGTPKGIDPENFFFVACTEAGLKFDAETNPIGYREFHAPTRDNPTLDPEGVANLEKEYPPLVYQQEYLAEFVDWSGAAFFQLDKWLENGQPIEAPSKCDGVFAVIDSATKTGREHDGTAVIYFLRNKFTLPKLVILDWEIIQIEGALLEIWLPQVFANLEALALKHGAREGSLGSWIEDKSSGSVLLQKAEGKGWPAQAIDSRLTALGKDERAIGISGNHYRGEVKISREAHDKVTTYKETTRNHLRGQVIGFRIGDKDANKREDDLLDCYCYGVELALGAQEWAK